MPTERGAEARRLIRGRDRATLATGLDGWPYASLVITACDLDGTPLLLLSDLAQHTANLRRDPRVSLLFDDTGTYPDPLAGPRLTVLGRAEPVADPAGDSRLSARFVARHPSSAAYAGFGDFHLYRVAIERGHFVAGFGRIGWIDGADLRTDADTGALADAEAGIIEHMNDDHADAVSLYAERLLRRPGIGWRLTGIDPEGADLRRPTELGGEIARLDFPAPVLTPDAARAVFIELAAAARGLP